MIPATIELKPGINDNVKKNHKVFVINLLSYSLLLLIFNDALRKEFVSYKHTATEKT